MTVIMNTVNCLRLKDLCFKGLISHHQQGEWGKARQHTQMVRHIQVVSIPYHKLVLRLIPALSNKPTTVGSSTFHILSEDSYWNVGFWPEKMDSVQNFSHNYEYTSSSETFNVELQLYFIFSCNANTTPSHQMSAACKFNHAFLARCQGKLHLGVNSHQDQRKS